MKYLSIIFFFLFFTIGVNAQMLSDTSVAYSQIKKFYFAGLKDTSGFPMPQISQRNIVDSTETQFGIFIFQIQTSNDKPRLYFRNFDSYKIEIVKKYDLEPLFMRVMKYFRDNDHRISYSQKLQVIKKVMELLDIRLK